MEPSSGAQATAVPPPPLSAVPPPPAADAPGATGRVGLGELRGGEGFSLGVRALHSPLEWQLGSLRLSGACRS
jgi:hypothetical protein